MPTKSYIFYNPSLRTLDAATAHALVAAHEAWLATDRSSAPPDLSFCIFPPQLSLVSRDLSQAYLAGSRLVNCNLRGVKLNEAYLCGIELDGSDLSGAQLQSTDLRPLLVDGSIQRSRLRNTRFIKAIVHQCNFQAADLTEAIFTRCRGDSASFVSTDLARASFSRAVIRHCRFSDARFHRTDFTNADVSFSRGLIFSDCSIAGVITEPRCREKWTMLRRAFSGPAFVRHLALALAFVVATIGHSAMESALRVMAANRQAGLVPGQAQQHLCALATCQPIEYWELLTGWYLLSTPERYVLAVTAAFQAARAVISLIVSTLVYSVDRSTYVPSYYGTKEPIRHDGTGWERWWYSFRNRRRLQSYARIYRFGMMIRGLGYPLLLVQFYTIYYYSIPNWRKVILLPL